MIVRRRRASSLPSETVLALMLTTLCCEAKGQPPTSCPSAFGFGLDKGDLWQKYANSPMFSMNDHVLEVHELPETVPALMLTTICCKAKGQPPMSCLWPCHAMGAMHVVHGRISIDRGALAAVFRAWLLLLKDRANFTTMGATNIDTGIDPLLGHCYYGMQMYLSGAR